MKQPEFLEAVTRLAREGRPEPLKQLIAARVRGEREVELVVGEEVLRVCSPPLERDEPGRNAVLYTAFSMLRRDADPQGLECLRRAAMELFVAALQTGEDIAVVRDVARLVGHFRLVDSEELRPQLLNLLSGYLDGGLSLARPFEEVLHLDGEALERAIVAFDVWLATLPILAPAQSHLPERLQAVLREGCAGRLGTGKRFERQMSLLFLVFRALIKLEPALAASEWMLRMCQLVELYSQLEPKLVYRWLSLCQHQGVVFDAYPEWRSEFVAGLKKARVRLLLAAQPIAALFREGVETMQLGSEVGESCAPPIARSIEKPMPLGELRKGTSKANTPVSLHERPWQLAPKPLVVSTRFLPVS